MKNTSRILVLLTGGTICSVYGKDSKLYSDTEKVKIIEEYKAGNSPFAHHAKFESLSVLDILSENMTPKAWNILIKALKKVTESQKYDGVIILHGTDTLAFTSSLLGLTFSGCSLPIILVSAHSPLHVSGTNGHTNFRAAAELIINGIAPNVYAVYENSDKNIYVHMGTHLLQCASFSNDFFSEDMYRLKDKENAEYNGIAFERDTKLYKTLEIKDQNVLLIAPHVGLNYKNYDLEGISAVVHGTYHSESVCVERSGGIGDYSEYSILSLIERCNAKNTDVFLAPCNSDGYKYESTKDALLAGARYIEGQTLECAYAKTLIGCNLGLCRDELAEFLNKNINFEKINKKY